MRLYKGISFLVVLAFGCCAESQPKANAIGESGKPIPVARTAEPVNLVVNEKRARCLGVIEFAKCRVDSGPRCKQNRILGIQDITL